MKKIWILLLVFLLIPQVSFANGYKKLTLDDAIKLGTSSNLDVKSEKLNIDIAKNNIKAANRFQNPSINVYENFGQAGKGNPQQVGISEDIELFKRGARKKLAKSNFELAKQNTAFVQFNSRMDIREAYVDLVSAKSILKALESQQQLLKELLDVAQKRFNAGATPEMDVIQARIALNQMTTQINSARVDVESARYEFNKALNVKGKDVYDANEDILPENTQFISLFTPSPKKSLPEFSTIENDALNKRFDIKIAKQQIDVANKNLTVVKRQRIPDLSIQGGYSYQPKHYSEEDRFMQGGYIGGSLVNLPIFYNYSPEIKNAKLQVEQAKLNYDSVQNKAINNLDEAYEKFVTSRLNLNYYDDKLLKDSNEMIRISKRSYEVGKSNLTTLIVMEQSYRSIIVGYTNALASYYDCWIDFLREVNNEEFMLDENKL
ncbi:MAG: TolC family protein [Clostridiaceae bacterium]|jgi:outer membrane protein, heavy metal efflux system|nr:TolC family protein [Clostridiaceae bacterium]